MGYCPKGHADEYRYMGLDAGNAYYETCQACGEVWNLGVMSPESAAVLRTAMACGRSWKTAYRMAREYPAGGPFPGVGTMAAHTPAKE